MVLPLAGLNFKYTSIDPLKIPVVSPKASVCTRCHDSAGVRTLVTSVRGATCGNLTQGDDLVGKHVRGMRQQSCLALAVGVSCSVIDS